MNLHSQLLYPSSRPGTPGSPTTQDNSTRRMLPNRERRATEKGQSWQSQVAQDAQARAQREVTQKRKAEAEARPNSRAPGPIDTPSKRQKTESSQVIDESILRKPYEELTTDDDRAKWYRAAIYRRDGYDPLPLHFDLVELEEMFDDPDAAYGGAQPAEELGDETVLVLPREDVDEEPPSGPTSDEVTLHSRAPTPLAHLGSSDYTTTVPDVQPNSPPGPDDRFPLSSSGNVGEPPEKGKSKADNRPISGPQHRPRDAAPPPRFRNSLAATLREPHAPATTSTNRTRSSLPSSAHATGPYTPNPPSCGAGKPSPPTSAQPSTPFKRAALAKSSRNAAAPASKSSGTGPTRKVARPSDPRSKRPNRSSTALKPKSSHVRLTQSAKHRNSRHKGGRRAKAPRATRSRRQPAEDDDESNADDEDEDEDEDEGRDVEGGTSSRGSHKLEDFGKLRWLVQAVSVRIKIRALKENPYADFTVRYSEPDENGNMHPNGYILDDWLTEEWRRVWGRRHSNDRVPRMEQQHVKWLYDRLSRVRNAVKAAVSPKISHAYNLNRRKSVEENKATVQRLGIDAFMSPTLTAGDCCAFQHPIFQEVIQDAFFSRMGRSFGYKHPKAFRPVPMGVYGLVATMIYVCIQEYATGIQVSTDLKGEEQLPWYELFIKIYEDIGEYNYQKFENVRMQTFDESYGISYAPPLRRLPVPPRKFGPDTQEVYHSRVHLSDNESDENMPFAPPTAESSGSNTASPHSSRESSVEHESLDVTIDFEEGRQSAPTLWGKSSDAPVEELVFTNESSD